jgi:SAM-dependent methyltransferase
MGPWRSTGAPAEVLPPPSPGPDRTRSRAADPAAAHRSRHCERMYSGLRMDDTYARLAELYDLAFSWEVEEEVGWLLGRFGPGVKRLLEPGCGSGRMFPGFARRGVEVTGVDRSRIMLERARERMRAEGLDEPELICADMAEFDLDLGDFDGIRDYSQFDGALCPVGSIAHLVEAGALSRHLACVKRHLVAGAIYMVQLELRDCDRFVLRAPSESTRWEMDSELGRVRCTWYGTDFDPARRIETNVSRFEILSGEREGEILEQEHTLRVWDWTEWQALLEQAGWMELAAYDGVYTGHSQLPLGEELHEKPVVWHAIRPRF